MADLRNVSGTGYGSAYVDALIAGGAVWDTSMTPIKFWYGDRFEKQEAIGVHGGSAGYYSGGTFVPYLGASNTTADWDRAYTWGLGAGVDERLPIDAASIQFENVSNIRFTSAASLSDADMVGWKTMMPQGVYSESETPLFAATNNQSWLYLDTIQFGNWDNAHPGGFGFHTILHMLGLAVGLANSHDGGYEADATTFPGVQHKFDVGPQGLNQVPFTVMSSNYNLTGHAQPEGKWGSMKTLGAFDIAALQKLYGANTTTAAGDDVYELPTENRKAPGWYALEATGWSCIWDTGGNDTISGQKSLQSVTIDLRAATLIDNDPNAGGFISQQRGIAGGFTIANGVIVENAIGGFGNDVITGNDANNTLRGEGGNDVLNGGGGNDILNGGAGADQMAGGAGDDTYYVDNAGDVINDTAGVNKIIATTGYTLNGVYVNANSGTATVDNEAVAVAGTVSADTLLGNAKDNRLSGGKGNDVLFGGAGKDVFVFDTKLGTYKTNKKVNLDTVADFNKADDTIWLDNKIFKKLGKGSESKPGTLNKKFFKFGTKATDKDDYLILNKKTGMLSYDADGSGSQKAVDFIQLTKGLKLTHDDFRII